MSSCLVVRSWPVLSRAAGQARTAAQLGPRRSFQQAEYHLWGLSRSTGVQLVSACSPIGLLGCLVGVLDVLQPTACAQHTCLARQTAKLPICGLCWPAGRLACGWDDVRERAFVRGGRSGGPRTPHERAPLHSALSQLWLWCTAPGLRSAAAALTQEASNSLHLGSVWLVRAHACCRQADKRKHQ